MSFRVKNEKCHFCTKTVYAMDRMAADNIVFHKGCMKCEHCGGTLSLGNFAALNGKYYCKPHFKQLFQTKGNYSDGFGEDKPTSKWEAKPMVYGSASPGADFTKPKSSPLSLKPTSAVPASPAKSTPVQSEDVVISVPETVVSAPEPEPVQTETPVEPSEPEVSEPEAAAEPEEPEQPEPTTLEDRMSSFTVDDKPAVADVKVPQVTVSAAGGPLPPIKKDACAVCGKTVYAMEKMVADKVLFHKNCMKCTHCSKTLGLGNFAALNGKYYCKPHFKQLFQTKGNYSDGFGEEKPTSKWDPQAPGYATGGPKNFFSK
jgi:hypothetical protein